MRNLTNKKFFKVISLMLVIIFITNVFLPIYSYAKDEDETFGGKLFKPVSKLVCAISDAVIMTLQKIFLGYGKIKDEQYETEDTKSTVYQILYSPAVIFSNKVPALNSNFMNPPTGKYQTKVKKSTNLKKIESYTHTYYEGIEDDALKEIKAVEKYGYDPEKRTEIVNVEEKNKLLKALAGMTSSGILYTWDHDSDNDGINEVYYLLIHYTSITSPTGGALPISTVTDVVEYSLYDDSEATIEKGDEREYSAAILQKVISKWYKALRLIALVGLLSVLVYVGIRIIISSTGQEKAKYKKMITDWLAAVCILFVLQYIMSFTVAITSNLIDLFPDVVNEEGADTLMSQLRTTVGKAGGTFWNVFGETVMYATLVIFTCLFTVHYLKRLVYLAFLTMIAPLIALTYPLDKIKDRASTSIFYVAKRICI